MQGPQCVFTKLRIKFWRKSETKFDLYQGLPCCWSRLFFLALCIKCHDPLRILLFSLLLVGTKLQAQGYDNTKYGPFSQLHFSVMPALYNNLDYQNIGEEMFKSNASFGGQVGISYSQAFWKGFGIDLGAAVQFVAYDFTYVLRPDSFSVLAGETGFSNSPNGGSEMLFTFPVLLQKKIRLYPDDRLFLNLEAGINWNIKSSAGFTSRGSHGTLGLNGEIVRFFEYRFTNADEMEFMSYAFKVGLVKVNRRGNSIHWNIVLHRNTSTRLLTGTYQFNEVGFPSFGTIDLYNNYIGMEFIYGLSLDTRSNRD